MDTQLNEQACNLNSPLCARASEWMNGSSRWMNEWMVTTKLDHIFTSLRGGSQQQHSCKNDNFQFAHGLGGFLRLSTQATVQASKQFETYLWMNQVDKANKYTKIQRFTIAWQTRPTTQRRRRSRPFSKVPNLHPSIPGGEAGEWGPSLLAHPRKTPKGQCQCPASERVINTKLNSCIHLPNRMFFFCLFLGGCWSRFYFN